METENTPTAPTSIVLISIFWILIGTFILAITSRYLSAISSYNILLFGLIPFLIAIGLIMVGWGLLTFRKWAYYIALIFSLLGTIFLLIFNIFFIGFRFLSDWYYIDIETILWTSVPIIFLLMFVFMFWYLIKNKNYFEKKQ
jgi:hypothetical protein